MNGMIFYAINGLIINEMKGIVHHMYDEEAKHLGWNLETI